MHQQPTRWMFCDCGSTMQLDRASLPIAEQDDIASALCGKQADRYDAALAESNAPICVACLQEAPFFTERAEGQEQRHASRVSFLDIRDSAGWSDQADRAGPKMAALTAASVIPMPAARFLTLESAGRCLVYGNGELAIEIAARLAGTLGVTCMLQEPLDALPPRISDFPIHCGRIRRASGHFGAFDLIIDGFAERDPSLRRGIGFLALSDEVRSSCDVLIDVTGEAPLFPHAERRDGYLRVTPNQRESAYAAVIAALHLIGSFEKPIYVTQHTDLCAHARNRIVGCTRCLDLCPAGAISVTDDSDVVTIDPALCGGCGLCAAACPTGAVQYATPDDNDQYRRFAAMVTAYEAAGGEDAEFLLHDDTHGSALISAMARYGRGLPARVIPVAMHSSGRISHADLLFLLSQGASRIFILIAPQQRADLAAGLQHQVELVRAMLAGIGDGDASHRVVLVEESDPDLTAERLYGAPPLSPSPRAPFQPSGQHRSVARLALRGMGQSIGTSTIDNIALPAGAPYGAVQFDAERCTLCLSCVSACPAGALLDNTERPQLLFHEDACVQCGLCQATCPENAITALLPRFNLSDDALSPVLLCEDEPFACVECGKPFGTTRSIAVIRDRLSGQHWMFANSERSRLIEMCADCRVEAQFKDGSAPFAAAPRPLPRTTEDYLQRRDAGDDEED